MEEDLRTGIAHADFKIAFEIDHFDEAAHTGWSVLVQGDVHPMESDEEQAMAAEAGVESWAAGDRNLFLRITPTKVTGHRVGKLPGKRPARPGRRSGGQADAADRRPRATAIQRVNASRPSDGL